MKRFTATDKLNPDLEPVGSGQFRSLRSLHATPLRSAKILMTQDEAKEFLSFHSGRHSDIEHPKWENGFLGSLRPYKGILFEENFHEVIECKKPLKSLQTKPSN